MMADDWMRCAIGLILLIEELAIFQSEENPNGARPIIADNLGEEERELPRTVSIRVWLTVVSTLASRSDHNSLITRCCGCFEFQDSY